MLPPWVPHSDNMPEITWAPPLSDILANLGLNTLTLTPVFSLLFGIIFVFYVLKKIINKVVGEDEKDNK